jgi:hypothetical protein
LTHEVTWQPKKSPFLTGISPKKEFFSYPFNVYKTVIKVETYSGYKADERPVSFTIRDRTFTVREVLDRWYGEGHDYFKVMADDEFIYILRHDRDNDEWELVMMEKGASGPP